MRRYLILIAAVGMQACLGATYSWSVFVKPLREWTGLAQGPVQAPFTVFYIAFPATAILAGMMMGRLGPRRCAMAGGLLFGGGWVVAGLFGAGHFLIVVLGIGLLGGVGVGLAYLVPITTCMLWFPRRKGLVTGIAVAGFGGGAALISQIAAALIQSRAATPFEVFRLLGMAFMVVVPVAGSIMRRPTEAEANARDGSAISPRQTQEAAGPSHDQPRAGPIAEQPLGVLLRERVFWQLYFAMFAGLMAGFAVNANLKELCKGATVKTGVTAVGVFALANALGRVAWGMVFDQLRSAVAIRANLLFQAAVLIGAAPLLRSPAGLQAFAFLAGLNYGGVLVIYASATARLWGAQRTGPIYGWLFSSNIPASLAPLLAGMAYDRWGSFALPLAAIGACLVAASLLAGQPLADGPLADGPLADGPLCHCGRRGMAP